MPPIRSELTTIDETINWVVLTVLKIPSNPNVVLVVRLFIKKLLAVPVKVEIAVVEILEAVNKPVLNQSVLRLGGKLNGRFVSKLPSPANFAVIRPAEIVEKKP